MQESLPRAPGPSEDLAAPSAFQGVGAAAADFALRRLGFVLLVLLSITFLTFSGLDMSRGKASGPAVADGAQKTVHYLARLAHGDLGVSTSVRPRLAIPVAEVVGDAFPKSLGLLGASLCIAAVVGVLLGSLAARRRPPSLSTGFLLLSLLGVSLPSFFTALLLQVGVIAFVRTFGRQLVPVGGFGWDAHLVLPALVLAARPIAQIFRVTQVSLATVLDEDYVRTGRAKGLPSRTLMFRHVYPNVAIPILTTLGLSLRFSLVSLPVVELFFSWPGAGFNLLRAVARKDDELAVALILCFGLLFIVVNLLLEAAYRRLDPRLREAAEGVRGTSAPWRERVRTLVQDLRLFFAESRLVRWLRREPGRSPEDVQRMAALRDLVRRHAAANHTPDLSAEARRRERARTWLRATLGNPPLLIGAAILGLLVAVALGAPYLVPHSPYQTQGLKVVNGQMQVPPFPPSEEHPWGTDVMGRDICSLVLAGTQRTLTLAVFVVLARVALGTVLGMVAGWSAGSWVDRFLLSLAETLAAFPTLVLAMVLILALGIRNGLPPFIIALSFVGWSETMQFVRSKVQSIRPQPFIEAAVATGLRLPQILLSHVLPNLVSHLIALAALEMGAVLMLLGELGFIGIFIGGGAYADLQAWQPPYLYSDVPEWGALLSNVRLYARSYTWTAFYPAAAFFLAILAFNLFGEGLRRLIEMVGAGFTRLVNRTTLALATLLVLTVVWVQTNVTPLTYWLRQAQAFQAERAMQDVQYLASEELQGRALGTPGLDQAAQYLAEQYRAAGLQAAGEPEENAFTYFQKRFYTHMRLDEVPVLEVDDGGPPLHYRQDYVAYPGPDRGTGAGEGPVTWVGIGELRQVSQGFITPRAVSQLDFRDQVVLVLSDREASLLQGVRRAGLLVVAEDARALAQGFTLSGREPAQYEAPALWISEAVANRLLAPTGRTVADLRQAAADLGTDEVVKLSTPTRVRLRVSGTTEPRAPAYHVIAHLPGVAATGERDTEMKLDDEMILVLAPYDGVGLDVDGTLYPGANDRASAVALMLEIARSWRESGYQPKRTFLFVNYVGEGTEYGHAPDEPMDPVRFLEARRGFKDAYTLRAIIHIRGVASPAGDRLLISTGGSMRLADLLEQAARRVGVRTQRVDEPVDLSKTFSSGTSTFSLGRSTGQEAPTLVLEWEGREALSRLPEDTPDRLSEEHLREAGQAISLALMALGSLTTY
ncbi:MAG: ABC transporter permease subunit [Anaerolineae bacterium]